MHSDSKSNSDGQHRIAPNQQAWHTEGTIRYRDMIHQGAGIAQHSLPPERNQEKLEAILPFPPMMHTTNQGWSPDQSSCHDALRWEGTKSSQQQLSGGVLHCVIPIGTCLGRFLGVFLGCSCNRRLQMKAVGV